MESDQRLSKGYGFVRFATAEAAALAAKVPHPKIDGRRVRSPLFELKVDVKSCL